MPSRASLASIYLLVGGLCTLPGCLEKGTPTPMGGPVSITVGKAGSDTPDSQPTLPPGCVLPTPETIASGEYRPLSRPLFIYVSRAALQRPEVAAFVQFYVESGTTVVRQVGYIALPEGTKAASKAALEAALTEVKSTAADRGTVVLDGSSTVFLISKALAEEYEDSHKGTKVSVGRSGTGGGFTKLAHGEIDIADASRRITPSEEELCAKAGIGYLELQVAIDGLTVVVNNENTFCSSLTIQQLKSIWNRDSTVKTWKDVDPAWPNEEIRLFGPDTDSGTFDYFTEAIVGKAKVSRSDYMPSGDDNQLVVGIAGEKYSLGYFGYAYYEKNKDKLKAVAICVPPEAKADSAPSK